MTMVEVPGKDKRTSLLHFNVNYFSKMFYISAPRLILDGALFQKFDDTGALPFSPTSLTLITFYTLDWLLIVVLVLPTDRK
jgi:hypothetical protein